MLWTKIKMLAFAIGMIGASALPAAGSDTAAHSGPRVIRMDSLRAQVLWGTIMGRSIDPTEALAIQQNGLDFAVAPSFSDEFDKARQVKGIGAVIKRAGEGMDYPWNKEYLVNVPATLGEYDFSAKAFPLELGEADRDSVVEVQRGQFGHGGAEMKGRYQIWYNIPEEIRTIELSELRAEKLMPRIKYLGRGVMLKLHLQPSRAEEYKEYRNLFFKTVKIEVVLPGGRVGWDEFLAASRQQQLDFIAKTQGKKGAKLPPAPEEIMLKTWSFREGQKPLAWGGAAVGGKWKGTLNYERFDKGDGDFELELSQSRIDLSGSFSKHRLFNANDATVDPWFHPLPEAESADVTGKVLGREKFHLEITNPAGVVKMDGALSADGTKAEGEFQNFTMGSGGHFVMAKVDQSPVVGEAAEPAGLAVAGIWHGSYKFNGVEIRFDAKLNASGATFEGTIEDYNDLPLAHVLSGTIDESGNVQFIKKYESDAAEVTYKGTRALDGTISGNWSVAGGEQHDSFVMKKE